CAYLSYMKDPFRDIPAFAKVTPDLYRGGPAKPEGYEILKKMGIKSILNLCQNEKLVSKDVSWAMDNGVIVHHMPIDLYSKPSDEQAISFLKIVLDKSNQPVFVHCEDGRDRTGTMVALYRVVVDNWTIKDAYHEARVIGYWPYHGDEAPLKMFVHQLKDKELYFRTARELMRND
ncbi:MAG: dual specificity protein phosphatase family protein, partial [Candidatus Omnitrophica bacterium]|nr:dual specificity protein phosphatase family protein [Candidatus Omnitrophota bacterium]